MLFFWLTGCCCWIYIFFFGLAIGCDFRLMMFFFAPVIFFLKTSIIMKKARSIRKCYDDDDDKKIGFFVENGLVQISLMMITPEKKVEWQRIQTTLCIGICFFFLVSCWLKTCASQEFLFLLAKRKRRTEAPHLYYYSFDDH